MIGLSFRCAEHSFSHNKYENEKHGKYYLLTKYFSIFIPTSLSLSLCVLKSDMLIFKLMINKLIIYHVNLLVCVLENYTFIKHLAIKHHAFIGRDKGNEFYINLYNFVAKVNVVNTMNHLAAIKLFSP